MQKTVLQESDEGIVFRIKNIPSGMFEFYILKKRTFKDKTHLYNIYVGLHGNSRRSILLGKIRGKRADAIKKMEQIIHNGATL